MWLDSSTGLPVKNAYSLRACGGVVPAISVEVYLSSYKSIAVMSSPGRNGLDLNFSLVYNSSICSIYTVGGAKWVPNSTNGAA